MLEWAQACGVRTNTHNWLTDHALPSSTRCPAATLAKCKPGVIIINAARGGIVNEADLLEGLNSGKVAGAYSSGSSAAMRGCASNTPRHSG